MGNERLADAAREDEGQLTVLDLFILHHQPHQAVDILRERLWRDRKPRRKQMIAHLIRILMRAKPELRRKPERHDHADGNGFAMQQAAAIASDCFERMRESMTEIEQRALAFLALVVRHDLRFVPHQLMPMA